MDNLNKQYHTRLLEEGQGLVEANTISRPKFYRTGRGLSWQFNIKKTYPDYILHFAFVLVENVNIWVIYSHYKVYGVRVCMEAINTLEEKVTGKGRGF